MTFRNETREALKEAKRRINELELSILKLEHPAKYKVGETVNGWLVIEFMPIHRLCTTNYYNIPVELSLLELNSYKAIKDCKIKTFSELELCIQEVSRNKNDNANKETPKHKLITYPEIRLKYFNETGKEWCYSNSPQATEAYITWLEDSYLNNQK